MKRLASYSLALAILALGLSVKAAPTPEQEKAREGLKELSEYFGKWKGNGGPDKPRPSPRDPFWSEHISWGWRFRGDDAWLILSVKGSKLIKSGEVRYLPATKVYQLKAKTNDDKEMVFLGKKSETALIFERVDPTTKEVQQLRMNTAADGDRLIYRYWRRNDGATIWKKDFLVAATREGVSLAIKEKKPECVVSGGLGTSTVSYMGETFYVCCSGCAEAFRENPKKYVDEFKAKKRKK